MMTSRPVEGVRMRYFWRVLIRRHATERLGKVPPAMLRGFFRGGRNLAAVAPVALLLLAVGGCAVKHPVTNLARGKELFVAKCGVCHTLSHANTSGAIGPNLDVAFRQDRADGIKTTSIEGLVDYWIQYPNANPNSGAVMPPKIYKGQQAQDVAAYVAAVAAIPGQDTGALATVGQAKVPVTPASGKKVFTGPGTCGSCHTLAAAGTTGTAGPNLGTRLASDCGNPSSKKIRGATLQQCIHTAIVNPYAYIPSGYTAGVMPNTFSKTLSKTQIAALVSFLSSVTH
jgi:mono/diheme cytochrome c family protein